MAVSSCDAIHSDLLDFPSTHFVDKMKKSVE